ncbi:MAG: amidohydrolase family protein [Caldithrix sp.]|nr:amidohydrolase family protein [Caldithrix sp.]
MLLIKNGRWLSEDGQIHKGNVLVEGRTIKAVNSKTEGIAADQVIDAADGIILPGAIDTHVHFREPGQLYKEGIANGSRAALRGGVTTIVDMPNNKPPTSTAKRLHEKIDRFRRKSLVNYGIQFHASADKNMDIPEAAKSTKIYMAKSSALKAITEVDQLQAIFAKAPRVAIHAEDETQFDTSPQRSPLHHVNRPRTAVQSALGKIRKALGNLPASKRPRVIICHMNTADEVDWLQEMKADGYDVWGETCPHYLYFRQDDYVAHGNWFKVNPPIRTQADQARLREAIQSGIVDFVGTDHAPHTVEEKHSDAPPSGIAAIEWFVPQMLNLLDEGLLSWADIHRLLTGHAAKAYDITQRDGIKVGNYADLVIIKKQTEGSSGKIQTKVQWNPVKPFHFQWSVQTTIVNGIVKYHDQRFLNKVSGQQV